VLIFLASEQLVVLVVVYRLKTGND